MQRRAILLAGAALAAAGAISTPSSAETYRQVFEQPKGQVFAALLATLPEHGFKVGDHDEGLGRIVASTGASSWSWGENYSFAVTAEPGGGSTVAMDSERKLATNITARGRPLKMFNDVVLATSRRLRATP